MEAAIFYIFSAAAVLFSLMVIFLRNPVTSSLSLVASFFCVSGIFVLLHAAFLGVIQVLIYAGAILVLFLYVLMLLNIGHEKAREGRLERGLRTAGILLPPVILFFSWRLISTSEIPAATVPDSFGSVASVGEKLLGPYALIFELVSLVLLAAILGVVALAGRKEDTP